MNKFYYPAIMILVLIIVICFFLPWVRVESEALGTFSKVLTGKAQAVLTDISAFQVPVMANDKDARLMLSIIKIFYPKAENADKKTYLIWGVPLLAMVILLASLFFGKNKFVNLAFGIIGVLIFVVALYKIQTTDLDKMVLKVSIGPGLWLVLWAYLGIGIVGFLTFVKASLKKT